MEVISQDKGVAVILTFHFLPKNKCAKISAHSQTCVLLVCRIRLFPHTSLLASKDYLPRPIQKLNTNIVEN